MNVVAGDDVVDTAIRFTDQLGAEFTKVRTLPSIWVALGVALAGNLMLGALAANDAVRIGGSDGLVAIGQVGTLMLAPVHVFVIIAVFAAGSEFSGGQVRVSLLAVPRRDRLFVAKLSAGTAVSLVAAVLVVIPGYVVQHAGGVADGSLGIDIASADLAAMVVAYLLLAIVGFGFALAVRGVLTPLAVLSVTAVLATPVLRGGFPGVVKYLPHEAALSLVRLADGPAALDRQGGLLVLVIWSGAFLAAAWVSFTRRDSVG